MTDLPHDEVGPRVGVDGAEVLDARGLRCPLPVVRLARLTRDAAPGTRVTVLWSDPAAEHDIPAWARMRGHAILGTERHEDHGATTVRIGG